MNIWQAIILGIVQGATEFLPISSSGHLVLVPALLGWEFGQQEAFVFDVWVQMGTLLAVIVYFWGDLWSITRITLTSVWHPGRWSKPEVRLGVYLLVATIPAVVIGLFFKDWIEAAFSNPQMTALFLLLTAGLLMFGEWRGKRQRDIDDLHWPDALIIGLFQALALLPGVSRSGATITGGLTRNMERGAAARFSFLMSVPVMIGASILTWFDVVDSPLLAEMWPQILAGMTIAALVGFAAIHWLLKFLATRPISWFAGYLVVLSLLVLWLV